MGVILDSILITGLFYIFAQPVIIMTIAPITTVGMVMALMVLVAVMGDKNPLKVLLRDLINADV